MSKIVGKDEKGRPVTWDMVRQNKKRPVRKIVIPLDDELAAEWSEVDGKVTFNKMRLDMGIDNPDVKKQVVEELAKAQAERDSLKEAMGDNIVVFRIRGLGRKKYEALKDEPIYQATDEQLKIARERHGPDATLPWNTDTFPPVLIQACMEQPQFTLDQVHEMWEGDDWTQAELMLLLNAALEVNEQVRNIDWGKD